MKIVRALPAIVALSLLVGACGGTEQVETATPAAPATDSSSAPAAPAAGDSSEDTTVESDGTDSAGEVEVDKGLVNVEILLPADFIEFFAGGQGAEAALGEISDEGFDDYQVNSDGSVLLKMSRIRYERLMDEQRAGLEEYLAELTNSGIGVTKAEANRSFTEFEISVDRASAPAEVLDSLGFLTFALSITAGFYQVLDGIGPEDTSIDVKYFDAATGEEIDVSLDGLFEVGIGD